MVVALVTEENQKSESSGKELREVSRELELSRQFQTDEEVLASESSLY